VFATAPSARNPEFAAGQSYHRPAAKGLPERLFTTPRGR